MWKQSENNENYSITHPYRQACTVIKHGILFYCLQIQLVIYCYELNSKPVVSSGLLCVMCSLLSSYVCKMNSVWKVKWHFYRIQTGSKTFMYSLKVKLIFLREKTSTLNPSLLWQTGREGNAKLHEKWANKRHYRSWPMASISSVFLWAKLLETVACWDKHSCSHVTE